MRIFLSAGEASGDAYAAALVRALQEQLDKDPLIAFEASLWQLVRLRTPSPNKHVPADLEGRVRFGISEVLSELGGLVECPFADAEHDLPWHEIVRLAHERMPKVYRHEWETPVFEGMGGPRLAATGAKIYADSSKWGAISIAQSLGIYPRIVGSYYDIKRKLREGIPGLFIPIDFGYANIRLARHAKNHRWQVLYFVPPGSWRRDRQGGDLPAITDAIVTPFSWSAEILQGMGANAFWFGHPIKELQRDVVPHPVAGRLAVLPGSRDHEIEANLPLIAESLKGFSGTVEFALAPNLDPAAFQQKWRELAGARPNDLFTKSQTQDVLNRARAAIVCSGTATLEAAVAQCPMVVVYRLTPSMRREAKLLRVKRPKFIALPNIFLDRLSVPELVDMEATPEVVRGWVDKLMEDSPERSGQLRDFAELTELLGPSDAITQTAGLALRMLLGASGEALGAGR